MGKYAVLLVLAMTFGLITYGNSIRNNMLEAETQITRDFSISQAKNIAQSAALIATQKVADPNDDSFVPGDDQTLSFPATQGEFLTWDDMFGEYRIDLENQADTLLVMTSTGRFDGNEYQVTVTMDRGSSIWNPNLNHAVFAGTSIDLTGSAAIHGDTGTNAVLANSVQINGNPRIHGGLQIGPGGIHDETVNYPNWGDVTIFIEDGISNLPAPQEYELPPFPSYPPKNNIGSNISLQGNASLTMPPGSYDNLFIPEISVRSNTTLTIDTGGADRTIHVGNLDIRQGHVDIIGGGDVTFMVEDNITLNGSSTLNNASEQSSVFTYYSGSNDLDFAGNTTFNSSVFTESSDIHLRGSGGIQGNIISGGDNVTIHGNAEATSRVVYAPNAHVNLAGSGRIRGAVISDSFRAVGNARVYYDGDFDHDLPEFESGDGTFNLLSWY